MPWLIKDEPNEADNLFFIHVPRCGGTSLMKSHNVPVKCLEGRNLWRRTFISIFFWRYNTLESANFPWKTRGSLVILVAFTAGLTLLLLFTQGILTDLTFRRLGVFLMAASFVFFMCLTFIFTAPVIGRITLVRRVYLIVVEYILCRGLESQEWCTGTNIHGYINHLTAHKVLDYGYIAPDVFDRICTVAIVRNPYSRMVSIYLYNRFGRLETFETFVQRWFRMLSYYHKTGEMEEWYTPCHGLPQFEYTHYDCQQIVQSIVKQEELKHLKTCEGRNEAIQAGSSVKDLPQPVLTALLGMPRANARACASAPWYTYYTQQSLNLTFAMYQHDFEIFQYSTVIEKRPDLHCPQKYCTAETGSNSSSNGETPDLESSLHHPMHHNDEEEDDDEDDLHNHDKKESAASHFWHNYNRNTIMITHCGNNGSITSSHVSDALETMSRDSKQDENERESRRNLVRASARLSSKRTSMKRVILTTTNTTNNENNKNSKASSAPVTSLSSLLNQCHSSLKRGLTNP